MPPPLPSSSQRRRFRSRLLTWYRANGRDLPWRKTDDPYHILVSEVMLQQTQVDRVLPKYHEWLEKYPSLQALAEAQETEVAATWRPLGYNVRPTRRDPGHQRRARALPCIRRTWRTQGACDEAFPVGGLAHRAAPPPGIR